MNPILQFLPLLNLPPKKAVITTHQKPDGDALGSSLGLYHYLKKRGHYVSVVSPTNWPAFLDWMPGSETILDFEARVQESSKLLQEADWIFCLDFNHISRVRRMEPVLEQAPGIKILIDHHQEPQSGFFDFGVSDTSKSSTSEMVYDFIMESGGAAFLDREMAECLYAGVMTDTGSFRFPATSASVHRMVALLMEKGLRHHLVHERIYDQFLENRLRFLGHVLLNRMEVMYEWNTVLLAISKDDLRRFDITTGDTEGVVNFPLSLQGIRFAAVVIDRDEERKWSFRSKGQVDVNQFARRHFSGGGHKNAAGGRSVQSLEETVRHFHQVLPELQQELCG